MADRELNAFAVGYLMGLDGGRPLILRLRPLFAFRQKAVVRGDRVVSASAGLPFR